jgi:hypothetical protein
LKELRLCYRLFMVLPWMHNREGALLLCADYCYIKSTIAPIHSRSLSEGSQIGQQEVCQSIPRMRHIAKWQSPSEPHKERVNKIYRVFRSFDSNDLSLYQQTSFSPSRIQLDNANFMEQERRFETYLLYSRRALNPQEQEGVGCVQTIP